MFDWILDVPLFLQLSFIKEYMILNYSGILKTFLFPDRTSRLFYLLKNTHYFQKFTQNSRETVVKECIFSNAVDC